MPNHVYRRMRVTHMTLQVLAIVSIGLNAHAWPAFEARIVDSDGYANVRQAPTKTAKVDSTIKAGTVVVVGKRTDSSWWPVRHRKTFVGFVHKSRLALRGAYPIGALHVANRSAERVVVWIRQTAFDTLQHTLTFTKDKPRLPQAIDSLKTYGAGKRAYGVDYSLPKFEIDEFEVLLAGKPVRVRTSLYRDCYEPDFSRTNIAIRAGSKGTSVRIHMAASDGAGAYRVTWTIGDSKQTRQVYLTDE